MRLSPAAFAEEFTSLMPIIVRGMMRREEGTLHKENLTLPQFLTLHLLAEKGDLRMNEIAKELNVTLPAATGLIERIHRMGLVKREYDQADRRTIRITMTPKGKKTLEMVREIRRGFIEQVFGKLSDRERADHLTILRKVRDIITGA